MSAPPSEHGDGDGVAQQVRVDSASQPCPLGEVGQELLHDERADAAAADSQKQNAAVWADDQVPANRQIVLHRPKCPLHRRHGAVLTVLAATDLKRATTQVDVVHIEVQAFRQSQGTAVEHLDDGAVAQIKRVTLRDGGDERGHLGGFEWCLGKRCVLIIAHRQVERWVTNHEAIVVPAAEALADDGGVRQPSGVGQTTVGQGHEVGVEVRRRHVGDGEHPTR